MKSRLAMKIKSELAFKMKRQLAFEMKSELVFKMKSELAFKPTDQQAEYAPYCGEALRMRHCFRGREPLIRGFGGAPALLLLLLFVSAATAQSPDTPRIGIVDQTGVIDAATQGRINAVLMELEQRELAMFKVLVVNSTSGVDPHDYALRTAKKWKLGTRGKDNGMLLLVAVKDRKWRFETGEGLEGAVPDIFTDGVARREMAPRFKQGDYSQGIHLAVASVARKIAADQGVQLNSMPVSAESPAERRRAPQGVPAGASGAGGVGACGACCVGIFPFLMIFMIIAAQIHRNRYGYSRSRSGGGLWTGILLGSLLSSGSRHHGGWSSGGSGGGFGGGGGGFGGGFGGSFGGGGSGGSW